jgi:hypothetical protein
LAEAAAGAEALSASQGFARSLSEASNVADVYAAAMAAGTQGSLQEAAAPADALAGIATTSEPVEPVEPDNGLCTCPPDQRHRRGCRLVALKNATWRVWARRERRARRWGS